MEEQTTADAILQFRDALDNLGRFLHHDGAMLTGWALVCEWMDASGDVWMTAHSDRSTPPWRVHGLMSFAMKQEDLLVPLDTMVEDDDTDELP